ncbi:hypothetical protein FRC09_004303 [Ceratobasidium sp. 395]|nr:hypothetical protein FRC09_004303 [Ceratobasidium sp. 395]
MSGPHRVKTRTKTKLRGVQFAFNDAFSQEDKTSQDTLLPVHSLSRSASQKRGEASRRLVSQEFSKLSALDQATLTDYADRHSLEVPLEDINFASIIDEQVSENEGYEDVEDDFVATSIVPPSRYRSWIERTHNASMAWSSQYEELANAFLEYNTSTMSECDPSVRRPCHEEDANALETFTVEVVDIFDRQSKLSFTHPRSEHRNATLVKAGYFSPSPTNPTTAITILRTLKMFKALRRRMPQFSIQAFTKTICDLHSVPYKRYLRDQLSTTLDVFFTVLRIIDSRLLAALKRDGPDWRLKNACPACTYKLDDEPELTPAMMVCGDGNVSLKRYVRSGENDPRTFASTYILEPDYVDQYQFDGASQKKRTENQSDVNRTDDDVEGGESACAPRWKNARNENAKDSSKVLDETGVFVVLCRHGMVLVVADMIRSGERAKYPLSTFAKVIKVHGKKIMFGYDIGCQHSITASRHPLTCELIRENDIEYAVAVFHGYAHRRQCQLLWHPRWKKGVGMEDFEGCERFFSHSNGVARCTQHGTKYNRRQQIHQHIEVSDSDILANMAKFLYNNYRGAISQLEESLVHRNRAMDAFNIREGDFARFIDEERQYLASLSSESPGDNDAIDYITALEEMTKLQTRLDNLITNPLSLFSNKERPMDIDKAIAAERRKLTSQINLNYQVVHSLELRLDISERWTNSCAEWKQASEDRKSCNLQQIVNTIERLSLERMFELEKYGEGGTEATRCGVRKPALDGVTPFLYLEPEASEVEREYKGVVSIGERLWAGFIAGRKAGLPSNPGLKVAKIVELETEDPLKSPDIALH